MEQKRMNVSDLYKYREWCYSSRSYERSTNKKYVGQCNVRRSIDMIVQYGRCERNYVRVCGLATSDALPRFLM